MENKRDSKDFSGRVAFVTGGGSGIGRTTALAFADHGASVVVAGLDPEQLEEVVGHALVTDGGQTA